MASAGDAPIAEVEDLLARLALEVPLVQLGRVEEALEGGLAPVGGRRAVLGVAARVFFRVADPEDDLRTLVIRCVTYVVSCPRTAHTMASALKARAMPCP